MTNDITQAADRLRRLKAGEKLPLVYNKPDDSRKSTQECVSLRANDAMMVAAAVLLFFDQAPISEPILREIGFTDAASSFGIILEMAFDFGRLKWRSSDNAWTLGGFNFEAGPKIRGQLLLLLRALKGE